MADGINAKDARLTSGLVVPSPLADVLRPHQVDALHFMWSKLVDEGIQRVIQASVAMPLVERVHLYQELFGCVIGHSMGLGKTVTVLSFLLLFQQRYTVSDASAPAIRVIVLTPRSCTFQWQCSAAEWMIPTLFGDTVLPVYALLGSRAPEKTILEFYQTGGILLLGYEEYQGLLRRAKEGVAGSQAYTRVKSLFDYLRPPLPLSSHISLLEVLESPDVVVLDESHRLKRLNSKLVGGLMEHLRGVQLRVAITGTPLQNHLEEYNVMYSVVTGAMMQSGSFRRLFTNPIERGQCKDSTFQQFVEMQKCVASLRRFFGTTVHHCGPEVLERELPPRREYVILVGLSPKQEAAYRSMLKTYTKGEANRAILPLHHEAAHVCFHPALTQQRAREVMRASYDGPVSSTVLNSNPGELEGGEEGSNFSSISSDEMPSEDFDDADLEVALEHLNVAESPKLVLTLSLLWHISEELHEKVVLFSTYRSHLFLLQRLLWQRGMLADVMHGGLEVRERQRIIERFTEDASRFVLLCSTRASGVGINLVAANHCILFDVSWNPADDTQATYRLYRYGQQRPVTIYRIATDGTFEHVVFFYALSKAWLHKKIVDVADPTRYERHMKENYFMYPCRLPIDFERGDGSDEKRTPLPNNEAVQERWREYASRHSPALALTAPDGTFAWIRSISEHSFLLRDNTDDVIREMGKRFATQRPVPGLPVVLERANGERFLIRGRDAFTTTAV
ncbi:SNF2 DNA repair protein [Trypanosoma rangeli]|uniref:SNF2 DNA repair protein n=1 Tax=Trypanosoma rangeli TaxID=5698 RepID=A0A3R7M571_TRYRA|nr:SNF2 DNA repair protein [Trypanosoma rangeli]RNF09238.1 SNF2 DNA repair protein [Trypanosoma rangeli]|eukprot:RNF09238.1 SNF2 DNA repair protein [Trypanosoma rangeli]